MAQSTDLKRINFNGDTIKAYYPSNERAGEVAANLATSAMGNAGPVANVGTLAMVQFAVQPGHSAAAYFDVLGADAPTRAATAAFMNTTVANANARGAGLSGVTHDQTITSVQTAALVTRLQNRAQDGAVRT